jgi:hypothetical protein
MMTYYTSYAPLTYEGPAGGDLGDMMVTRACVGQAARRAEEQNACLFCGLFGSTRYLAQCRRGVLMEIADRTAEAADGLL